MKTPQADPPDGRLNFPYRGTLYTVTTKRELLQLLANISCVEELDAKQKARRDAAEPEGTRDRTSRE